MTNIEKWDRRYLEIAKLVAGWSKDPSVGVGAVLVKNNRIIATGYNGFPKQLYDDPFKLNDRPIKYAYTVHAEMNALLQAGREANGSTIYVYPSFAATSDNVPDICDNCAKHSIQAGVVGIVFYDSKKSPEQRARWIESLKLAGAMWNEAGNFMRTYEED
jgi:dCMP deaminase